MQRNGQRGSVQAGERGLAAENAELAEGRVFARVAQKLRRHSDIRLTMNTFTHLDLADTAGAVAALPPHFLEVGFSSHRYECPLRCSVLIRRPRKNAERVSGCL
jgi:hypothetical protein